MSTQIPAEEYKFLERILADSDMKDFDEEMRNEMIQELYARFDAFVIGSLLICLQRMGALKKMHEQRRPKAEIGQLHKKQCQTPYK